MANKKGKKKPPFMIFMEDYQRKQRKAGKHVPHISQLASICGPLWDALSEKEKESYKCRSEQSRNGGQPPMQPTVDNSNQRQQRDEPIPAEDGPSQPDEEFEDEDVGLQEEDMEAAFIRQLVEECETDDELLDKKFYFISTNVMLRVDDSFYPMEFGVVEYTLRSGILRHLHEFVDPGPIPTGWASRAKEHAEKTHKIPLWGFSEAVGQGLQGKKRQQLFSNKFTDLLGFIGLQEPYVMFSKKEQRSQVEGSIRALVRESLDDDRVKVFEEILAEKLFVFDLSILLFNICRRKPEFKRLLVTCEDDLDSTAYMYTPNINCSYHEQQENPYCALGVARRLAFNFSDVALKPLGITPTAKHLPTTKTQAPKPADDDLDWGDAMPQPRKRSTRYFDATLPENPTPTNPSSSN